MTVVKVQILFQLLGAALLSLCAAQKQQYTTPVPILKQINKHNEDGSYSYGYEGADGSFKIETKYPNGEVFGKYGYVDDSGKLREVEYGASRRGFEPAGNDINVAPPTISQQQNNYASPLAPNEEDDGQYREDPSVYYKDSAYNQPTKYTSGNHAQISYQTQTPAYQPQQSYQQPQQTYQQPQQTYQPQQYYRPQQSYDRQSFLNSDFFRNFNSAPAPRYNPPAPRYNNNPAPAQNYNYNPGYSGYNHFAGHPAQNLDINTGSYSINY